MRLFRLTGQIVELQIWMNHSCLEENLVVKKKTIVLMGPIGRLASGANMYKILR